MRPILGQLIQFIFLLHFHSPYISLAHSPTNRSLQCPHRCSCAHSAVICTGLGLLAIPKGIPPDTTRLDLQENRIQRIGVDDFVGLGQLRVLHLGDNLIEHIDPQAFSPLHQLERIRLGRNRLRTLPDGIFANNSALKRLDLSENNLWSLSTEQLAGPEQLVSLQLDHNQLQCLDSLALNRWHSLESISLASNALTSIAELDLAALPNLRTLRLLDNPWHCDCRLRWLKRLKVANQIRCHRPALLLGRSLDTISLKQLKCSGLEKREGGRRACRQADLCPPGCGCTESGPNQMVVDCHDRQLREIPQRLPPNTVELRLDQNRITHLENGTFWNSPRLARLDLSKNSISQIHSDAFTGLGQLNSLMLFANNLTDLPPTIFRGLSSLQVLLLNGNHLKCLRTGIFDDLAQLRLLSLYDNRIQSIAESTFAPLANSLQTLHLARNPLICDCNLLWIARLLATRPIETSGARCHSPRRVARKRIAILPIERFRCLGSERLVTQGAGQCQLDRECPEPCRCEGTIVDCSNRHLTAPPLAIPQFATDLLLANNEISHFPSIGHLPNLQFLNLSGNRLNSLQPNSLAGLISLRQLDIGHNGLRRFDPRSLGQIAVNSLQILNFEHNFLRCVPLAKFPSLRHLSIRANPNLISLGPIGAKLDRLDLDNTGQKWLCDCQLRPLIRMINSENLNWTNEEDSGPKCAEPAKLRGRPLATLDERELAHCKSDHNLVALDGGGGECTEEGEFCPRGCECSIGGEFDGQTYSNSSPSSIVIVRCSNRSLHKIPWGIPPDTDELLLDNNRIEQIDAEQFSGLSKLAKLDLSHNLLEHIPARVFAPLPSLATLILAHNRIRCLADSAFHGLQSLRLLSLHSNNISQLPESAFGPSILANLSHIALGANPLWCDCQMNWATRWIRSKFVEPGIARCDGPPSRRLQLLLSVEPFSPCPSAPPPANILAKCHPCLANPCANSAACFPLGNGQFRCQCPPGFHGKFCEHPVDACFGQPCQNGGECRPKEAKNEGRFECHCAAGFGGERCEQEKDECVEGGGNGLCLNGGTCRDELNGFRCECPSGWIGKFCENLQEWICPLPIHNSSNSVELLPNENCSQNLFLLEQEERALRAERAHIEMPMLPIKKCAFNFGGPNCSERRAIGLNRSDAFIPLGELAAEEGNEGQRTIELKFKTVQRDGILLWLGSTSTNSSSSFLLLEIVQGRLRSAIQLGPGHSPPSQLFSPILVNDGLPHSISLRLHGQYLSLQLDSLPIQSVLNSGPWPTFPIEPLPLFIGGIPAELGRRSLVQFRISDSSSIRGCFWDIHLAANSPNSLDLSKFIPQNGSTTFVDCAEENEHGKGNGKRKIRGRKCTKGRQGRGKFWTETGGKCRSIHPVANCIGQCDYDDVDGQLEAGDEHCCVPLAKRRRRIQMECLDGSKKWEFVELPRTCGCQQGKCLL